MAHESAQLGSVQLSEGELLDAGINRSPTAYLNNPEEERRRFLYDTDKRMTQLKITTASNMEIGLVNWFPVHGTALNSSVNLISGDNKGAASQMFEKHINKQRSDGLFRNVSVPGVVAAFAQSNSGDVTPNTEGAYCSDTGLPCDVYSSTCNHRNELCHGRGPGWPDSFSSSYIIAEKQFRKAKQLFDQQQGSEELHGNIDFRSVFLNMSSLMMEGSDGQGMCRPAMGYSFAAGTTDGPGMFDFVQGDVQRSTFWDFMGGVLHRISANQRVCHSPKPILIDTGEMQKPVPWQPEIVQLQLLKIGQLVLVCVPGELSTMAGRRLKSAVSATLQRRLGDEKVDVVISGLTNDYSSYITTYEEYQVQRYEGASTIFGPRTLEVYIQEFVKLAEDMIHGVHRKSRDQPPNYISKLWSTYLPVALDSVPPRVHFGDVHSDRSRDCYTPRETVTAEFWYASHSYPNDSTHSVPRSANPRNSLTFPGHRFLTVERYVDEAHGWHPVVTEDDLSTQFVWRPCLGVRVLPCSRSILSWTIEPDTPVGIYRIQHSGHAKQNLLSSNLHPFHGYSPSFLVLQSCQTPVIHKIEV